MYVHSTILAEAPGCRRYNSAMAKHSKALVHARRAIAAQAARLMAEDGLADFGAAKRKAARQLGFRETDGLPDNGEIEDALRSYQALYQNDEQRERLTALRSAALWLMHDLAAFRPYLSGAAWNGTATRGAGIELDLFTDDPKSLDIWLFNRAIPFTTTEKPHFLKASGTRVPVHRAVFDGIDVALAVHALVDERQVPKPGIHGQPERGTFAAVEQLLAADDEPDVVTKFLGSIR
jgi:hypothetical protein